MSTSYSDRKRILGKGHSSYPSKTHNIDGLCVASQGSVQGSSPGSLTYPKAVMLYTFWSNWDGGRGPGLSSSTCPLSSREPRMNSFYDTRGALASIPPLHGLPFSILISLVNSSVTNF